jgi:preprotein translocase subunit SecF
MWLLTQKQTKRFLISISVLIIAVVIYELLKSKMSMAISGIYALVISILALIGIMWVWMGKETNINRLDNSNFSMGSWNIILGLSSFNVI